MLIFTIVIFITLIIVASFGIDSYNNLDVKKKEELKYRYNFLIGVICFSISMIIGWFLIYYNKLNESVEFFFDKNYEIDFVIKQFITVILLSTSSISFVICKEYFSYGYAVDINTIIIILSVIVFLLNIVVLYKNIIFNKKTITESQESQDDLIFNKKTITEIPDKVKVIFDL